MNLRSLVPRFFHNRFGIVPALIRKPAVVPDTLWVEVGDPCDGRVFSDRSIVGGLHIPSLIWRGDANCFSIVRYLADFLFHGVEGLLDTAEDRINLLAVGIVWILFGEALLIFTSTLDFDVEERE